MTAGQPAALAGRRRTLALVPAVVFLALAGLFLVRLQSGGDASRIPSALIGKAVPTFALPPLTGLPDVPGLASADLRDGSVTVLNVFASWCVPCHEEHGTLMEIARDGTRLVGIVYKDDPENARRFLGEGGNPYSRVGADRNGRVGIDFGVTGVPETFVIRGDGTIAYKFFGPLTPEAVRDELRPAIRKAAGGG